MAGARVTHDARSRQRARERGVAAPVQDQSARDVHDAQRALTREARQRLRDAAFHRQARALRNVLHRRVRDALVCRDDHLRVRVAAFADADSAGEGVVRVGEDERAVVDQPHPSRPDDLSGEREARRRDHVDPDVGGHADAPRDRRRAFRLERAVPELSWPCHGDRFVADRDVVELQRARLGTFPSVVTSVPFDAVPPRSRDRSHVRRSHTLRRHASRPCRCCCRRGADRPHRS